MQFLDIVISLVVCLNKEIRENNLNRISNLNIIKYNSLCNCVLQISDHITHDHDYNDCEIPWNISLNFVNIICLLIKKRKRKRNNEIIKNNDALFYNSTAQWHKPT